MQKRQFIAGASCPKCAQLDSIVKIVKEQTTLFECVHCGFSKEQADDFNQSKPFPVIKSDDNDV